MTQSQTKVAAIVALVVVGLAVAYFGIQAKGGVIGLLASRPRTSAPIGEMGVAGRFAESEEIGPKDAKVKIIAVVPIANPCHKATVAALREITKAHPEEVHLTLVDFHGPDAGKWMKEMDFHCATVFINGEYQFELDGRHVMLEQHEGVKYKPEDLEPIVEAEIAKAT
jgi:hypothetical protein